jgi:hypothetical protein
MLRDIKAIVNHLKNIKKGQELRINELWAEDLSQMCFTFEKLRILIKGDYTDELFLAFVDEPNN